jgi:rhomboid family GlyGly-CTERM serine protease
MKTRATALLPPRAGALAACLALLLSLSLAGDAATRALRYERAALAGGEWWRLLGAHLVHYDAMHLAMNGAGFALLWSLFVRDARWRDWLVTGMAAAAAIDAGLWLLAPRVYWYLGLSGVLHGWWAAAGLAARARWPLEGALTLALLAAKLAFEQLQGPLSSGLHAALPVVVDAHLYGALGGLAAALGLRLGRTRL